MSTDTSADNWLEPLAALDTTTNSFIVTIRSEPPGARAHAGEWHGWVEHTHSRERIFFADYARLNRFIAARSETALRAPWRTRLARSWQRTRLYHALHAQSFALLAGVTCL